MVCVKYGERVRLRKRVSGENGEHKHSCVVLMRLVRNIGIRATTATVE